MLPAFLICQTPRPQEEQPEGQTVVLTSDETCPGCGRAIYPGIGEFTDATRWCQGCGGIAPLAPRA